MIDRNNPAWPGMKKVLEELIDTARGGLESADLSAEETALLRGEIRAYRKIILGVEGPPDRLPGGGGINYAERHPKV